MTTLQFTGNASQSHVGEPLPGEVIVYRGHHVVPQQYAVPSGLDLVTVTRWLVAEHDGFTRIALEGGCQRRLGDVHMGTLGARHEVDRCLERPVARECQREHITREELDELAAALGRALRVVTP